MNESSQKLSTDKHFTHYATIQYPWLAKFKREDRIFTGRLYCWLKRLMDLLIVLASLVVVFPLGVACVILIKLESPKGPVLFRQYRTGRGGNRFVMYKFRTMVMDAEDMKKDLLHLNELNWPDFKIANDPRITRFGKFLRKTSLDELPQIINVIRGEMSLVGPRPTSFSAETYELWQTERLDVLPGMTGLWQILGRGETEFDERLRWDILYIDRRSILFDIEILMRTGMVVFKQKGAS